MWCLPGHCSRHPFAPPSPTSHFQSSAQRLCSWHALFLRSQHSSREVCNLLFEVSSPALFVVSSPAPAPHTHQHHAPSNAHTPSNAQTISYTPTDSHSSSPECGAASPTLLPTAFYWSVALHRQHFFPQLFTGVWRSIANPPSRSSSREWGAASQPPFPQLFTGVGRCIANPPSRSSLP